MIFIIMGTEQFPFDRFVQEVDRLKGIGVLEQEVNVQLGTCVYEPRHCEWTRFLSFGEMSENIRKADLVIAHAGAGTTLLCLKRNQRPIIVTRMKKYGEHVDDHQVHFARKFQEHGLVDAVYEIEDLESKILERLSADKFSPADKATFQPEELTHHLDQLLERWK